MAWGEKSMKAHMKRVLGLLALIPGQAMVFLDQTILPVALPTIQSEFQATTVSMKWTINAYLLAIALFVLLGGKLVDAWGARRSLMAATATFITASILCALSHNAIFLIAARGLQGIGASLLIPASVSLLFLLFSKEGRGKAMGVNVSISSIFLILGPLLGGFIIENYTWHWLFLVNVPIGLLGIFLAPRLLPDSPRKQLSLDLQGLSWFVIATCGWVIALMQAPTWGWGSWPTLTLLAVGAVASLLLLRREQHAKHPYLHLELFSYPTFRASTISIAAAAALLMLAVFWAIYFQQTLGFAPDESGLLLFSSAIPVLFVSPIGGALSDHCGPRIPISLGFLCMILGLGTMALFGATSTPLLVTGIFVFGLGVPLIMTPSYSAGLGSIPSTKRGLGSGMISTTRACMATLSLALITAFSSQVTIWQFMRELYHDPALANVTEQQATELVLGYAPGLLEQFSATTIATLSTKLKEAQIAALMWLHFAMIVLLIGIWIWVLMVFHRSSAHRLPEHLGEGWD